LVSNKDDQCRELLNSLTSQTALRVHADVAAALANVREELDARAMVPILTKALPKNSFRFVSASNEWISTDAVSPHAIDTVLTNVSGVESLTAETAYVPSRHRERPGQRAPHA
jgi:hypothetical protein